MTADAIRLHAHAQRLSKMLQSAPLLQERIAALESHPAEPTRDLIVLRSLPKVTIKDVEVNWDILSAIIDFNQDDLASNSRFMYLVMKDIDADHSRRLSQQDAVALRDVYCNWEADKCRLLWSYFLRQLGRTEWSPNVWVYRLKQKLTFRRLGQSAPAAAEEVCPPPLASNALAVLAPPVVPCAAVTPAGMDLLSLLPDFPMVTNESGAESAHDVPPSPTDAIVVLDLVSEDEPAGAQVAEEVGLIRRLGGGWGGWTRAVGWRSARRRVF